MIHSDWHIHTTASYDANLPLETLIAAAKEQGLRCFGITDHLNFNDEKFMGDLRNSAANFKRLQDSCPTMILGVELTPVAKPQYDYIARTGTREGWVPEAAPEAQDKPYDIELAATKEELMALGVRYAVGAAHWRVDVADVSVVDNGLEEQLKEWYRQQLWMAEDERVTILGHPWYNGKGIWYEDLSVIPRSMNDDIAAVLKEHGKYVELNTGVLLSAEMPEKSRYLYAEMIRDYFEKGIPVTYGSDCHGNPEPIYPDCREAAEPYLTAAGFKEGDFSELDPKILW